MGSISVSDEASYRRLKDFARYLGYGVSADNCSLVLRSIATLAVRLDRCEQSALALAQWLGGFRCVKEVRHPALPGNPGHQWWKRDFKGSTGVFSLFLDRRTRGGLGPAIESLELFSIGASWGGTHSIVAVLEEPPTRGVAPTAHDGPIVRLSIGLEHVDDLKEDLTRAMTMLDASLHESVQGTGDGRREN
jgi:cystathionine beta-lyase